jgi:hypothetical protein
MNNIDYRRYYDLEEYLFGEANSRFKANRQISAFDFFCIVIWKANRAKSRIANLLLTKFDDLEKAVAQLTSTLAEEKNKKARLKILLSDWGFRLPMASAILTVLAPEEFTVYDIRVCNSLGNFHKTQDRPDFDELWSEYQNYIEAVRDAVAEPYELRDKDKWLWGKSFYRQLGEDIETRFTKLLRESALSWIRELTVGQKFTYRDIYKFLEATFFDECAAGENAGYKEDAKDAVKKDAIKARLIRPIGQGQFERVGHCDLVPNSKRSTISVDPHS